MHRLVFPALLAGALALSIPLGRFAPRQAASGPSISLAEPPLTPAQRAEQRAREQLRTLRREQELQACLWPLPSLLWIPSRNPARCDPPMPAAPSERGTMQEAAGIQP